MGGIPACPTLGNRGSWRKRGENRDRRPGLTSHDRSAAGQASLTGGAVLGRGRCSIVGRGRCAVLGGCRRTVHGRVRVVVPSRGPGAVLGPGRGAALDRPYGPVARRPSLAAAA